MSQTFYFTESIFQEQPGNTENNVIMKRLDGFSKRLLDIIASFIGLILLLPLFALISFMIKKDSPGPVFFKGKRLGINGTIFGMWKFRTMFEDPESYEGPRITVRGDKRITPFGTWLRETKINELPQLWNVLIGDMSLVGPRPEDVIVGSDWDPDAKKEILSVRPGITSPASIIYHDEESQLSKTNLMEDYFSHILPDKIRLDRLYVRNRSFVSDLDILFWTIAIIFPKMVTEKIPEGYLFSGPINRLMNQYLAWFVIDLGSALISYLSIGLLWGKEYPLILNTHYLLFLVLIPSILFSLLIIVFRFNKTDWSNATKSEIFTIALFSFAFPLSIFASNLVPQIFQRTIYVSLPINLLLVMGFLSQAVFLALRNLWAILSVISTVWLSWRKKKFGLAERVLIVGAGKNFSTLMLLLDQDDFRYVFNIVGVVDDDIPSKYGVKLNGCQVLGNVANLPEIVSKNKVNVIIFTTSKIPREVKEFADQTQKKTGVRLICFDYLSRIIEGQLSSTAVHSQHSVWSEDYFEYLAIHDNVTGLPNSIIFRDHLQNAIALGKRFNIQPKVMFITLDLYVADKAVDQQTWFEILRVVTERLQKIRRASDTLVFLGSCGFAFIFYNPLDDQSVKVIANRINFSLTQPITFADQSYILDPKINITTEIDEINSVIDNCQEGVLLDYLHSHQKIVRPSYV